MMWVHQPSLTFSHQDIPKAKNHVTHIFTHPQHLPAWQQATGLMDLPQLLSSPPYHYCGGHSNCFRLLIGPIVKPVTLSAPL